MRNCPEIKHTKKVIKYNNKEYQQKYTEKAQSKTSNKLVKYVLKNTLKSTFKHTKKKTHRYIIDNNSMSQTKESLSKSNIQEDNKKEEVYYLSKKEISKAILLIQLANTSTTLYMSDQPSLFSIIKLIKARHIKVRGRELLAKHKGSAKLQYIDGSLIILKDILYILRLRINLVLVRKLY